MRYCPSLVSTGRSNLTIQNRLKFLLNLTDNFLYFFYNGVVVELEILLFGELYALSSEAVVRY